MANNGLFIPTTQIWDVASIYEMEVDSAQFKELIVRLYQDMNRMALAINLKESGFYPATEFITGQNFLPNQSRDAQINRSTFRKVINFGPLPNTATTSVPHGINVTGGFTFTRIYGAATNPSNEFIPLPYASPTLAENIELSIDATNVNITTGNDRTAFTTTYVILEMLKS